jgi:hypothetical protein
VKTRSDLVRAEFGECLDHLRQAAGHAAGGVGATVGPRVSRTRAKGQSASASAKGYVGPAYGKLSGAASQSWESMLSAYAPLAESARQGSARAMKLDAKKNGKSNGKNKSEKDKRSRISFTANVEREKQSHTGLYVLLATGAAVGAAGALAARRRTRAKWAEYEPSSLHSDASSFRGAGATSSKSYPDKLSSAAHEVTDDDDGGKTISKAATWTKEHTKNTVDSLRQKIHEATADRDDDMSTAGRTNEGPSHLADKADAKLNDGSSRTQTSVSKPSNHVEDEVDELIRAAKNGNM